MLDVISMDITNVRHQLFRNYSRLDTVAHRPTGPEAQK